MEGSGQSSLRQQSVYVALTDLHGKAVVVPANHGPVQAPSVNNVGYGLRAGNS